MHRCGLAGGEMVIGIHDLERGVPIQYGWAVVEFLVLEGAQAGLSWETVLKKRDNYRAAFDNFDAALIAAYDQERVGELLANQGIIRNRLKIGAAIQNARSLPAVQKEFGSFDEYLWRF